MKFFITILLLSLTQLSFGQVTHRCSTPNVILYQDSITPGYAENVEDAFNTAKYYAENKEAKSSSNGPHTIPVVFHIVYNTPSENIPDSVIYNQLNTLNEDFNRLNPDTVNMRPVFDIVKGNPNINFELAQIDPNGNATTGITRTYTDSTFGSALIFFGFYDYTERVKSSATGGVDPWNQSNYLNIWVCNLWTEDSNGPILISLGYGTPPLNMPNWPSGLPVLSDGVVLHHEIVGSNPAVDLGNGPEETKGRVCTHEVGHYLGLRHIWGDGDCTAQDGIDDTPNAEQSINEYCLSLNNCVDNIQGVDLPNMFENYMDYSAESCQNTFTQGQADLMNAVLENQRYDLVHSDLSVPSQSDLMECSIHPNPTSETLTITSSKNISKVVIYTSSGKMVKSFQIDNNQSINVSLLARGFYLLEVFDTNDNQCIRRFAVQ